MDDIIITGMSRSAFLWPLRENRDILLINSQQQPLFRCLTKQRDIPADPTGRWGLRMGGWSNSNVFACRIASTKSKDYFANIRFETLLFLPLSALQLHPSFPLLLSVSGLCIELNSLRFLSSGAEQHKRSSHVPVYLALIQKIRIYQPASCHIWLFLTPGVSKLLCPLW